MHDFGALDWKEMVGWERMLAERGEGKDIDVRRGCSDWSYLSFLLAFESKVSENT